MAGMTMDPLAAAPAGAFAVSQAFAVVNSAMPLSSWLGRGFEGLLQRTVPQLPRDQRVSLVEDRGCFAVRGDLVDLFPPMLEQPVRLAFFGDELEEIRAFDPVSQRSLDDQMVRLDLVPAREMILAGVHLETFTRRFKERCDDLEIPRRQREMILEEVREGLLAPGRENLLPLNYEKLGLLRSG